MIAVVDYKAGNLTSVQRALEYLGHPCVITDRPSEVSQAERIVFPGVGAAGTAMANLRDLGLDRAVCRAIGDGKPFLGICLGFQILFDYSHEDDTHCLGVLPGEVVRFPADMRDANGERPLKVPEMGWNHVVFKEDHPVWRHVPGGSEFYFVHSYYPEAGDDVACAWTTYGISYTCGVARGSLVAFQFHPEKSGRPGLRLLDNFCRWRPC